MGVGIKYSYSDVGNSSYSNTNNTIAATARPFIAATATTAEKKAMATTVILVEIDPIAVAVSRKFLKSKTSVKKEETTSSK